MQLTVSKTVNNNQKQSQKQFLTIVGTIMSNRREILSQFKSARGREVESNKALYDHSNGILLILYIPKQNRNVSSHSDVSIRHCREVEDESNKAIRHCMITQMAFC